MLLQELFAGVFQDAELLSEDMASSAVQQLIYGANNLAVLYGDTLPYIIKDAYAQGNAENMNKHTKMLVGRAKGKWFASNYLSTSSSRNTPTTGIKNALVSLSKDPKFTPIHTSLKDLGGLAVYASSELRSKNDATFGSHVTTLEALPKVMKRMADLDAADKDSLQSTAVRLENSIDAFYQKWSELHAQWDRHWGAGSEFDTKSTEAKDKKQAKQNSQATTGAQAQQANALVDQLLSSLDPKVAASIRSAIARSDNKLVALDRELKARNISL